MLEGIDFERVWVCDSETFAHDNMWVFIHAESSTVELNESGVTVEAGETIIVHNDNDAIEQFIFDYDPILAGYNIRDYDQHILKANLLHYTPEQIKECNDVIIVEGRDNPLAIYEHFQGEPWVDLPPLIDLFPDIVNRPSLKQLEGFMGLSIEESSVPFDIDRPLTPAEVEDTFFYCTYDVKATLALLHLRKEYLASKIRMCEIVGVDPLKELKHPMPRVFADLLAAEFTEYPNEDYEIPQTINLDNIPDPAYWYCKMMDRDEGIRVADKNKKTNPRNVLFDFHGCPTVFGVGGIHSVYGRLKPTYDRKKNFKLTVAETVPYHEKSDDDRVILLQDASFYYPHTIEMRDYMSRSVPETHQDIFPYFVAEKDTAKAEGRKADESACKLFCNAGSGTLRSPTNKVSDPIQGIALCLTCQLQTLDVIERIFQAAPETRLIQVNTDGWMVSCRRKDVDIAKQVVADWCAETGYSVDTDEIDELWQRDVNNYCMLLPGGGVYVKGGTVGGYHGRGKNWALRGFSYTNTIIDKAIVNKLAYGIDIADTVNNETDLGRFQIIAKAGSPYPHVYKDCFEVYEEIPEGSRRKVPRVIETRRGAEVQRVNRIYATKDTSCGRLMKESHHGNLSKFSDTPPHAFVDNKNSEMTLDMLDRDWYTELATKKMLDFLGLGEKDMAEETKDKAAAEKPKATTTRKPAVKKATEPTFFEKYQALQVLVRDALATIEPNKYIEHISYEYVDTGRYKDVLAACCQEVNLVYSVQYTELEWLGTLEQTHKGNNNYGATVKGTLIIQDAPVQHPDAWYSDSGAAERNFITHQAYGLGIGSGGNCVAGAQTNAMRNAIINGLLVWTSFDDDVYQANKDANEAKKPTAYLSEDQKVQVKEKVKKDTEDSVTYIQAPAAAILYERTMELFGNKNIEMGSKTEAAFQKLLDTHYTPKGKPREKDGHLTLTKKMYVAYSNKLDDLGIE